MENRRDGFEKELKDLMKKYDVTISIEGDLLDGEKHFFQFKTDYLKGEDPIEPIDVMDFWRA